MMFYSILFAILSLCYSVKQPKLCINCKHFLDVGVQPVFGKCALFPNINGDHLVIGVKNNEGYYRCSTARTTEVMCGEEGKYFVKKRNKKPKSNSAE